MQEQKKYHQRKLAIIEMIELCEMYIVRSEYFHNSIHHANNYTKELSLKNSIKNIKRYELIKAYLTERYNRN